METIKFINRYTNTTHQLPVYRVDEAYYVRVKDVHKIIACESKVNKWIPSHGKFKFPELMKQYGIHPNEKFVRLEDARSFFGVEEHDTFVTTGKYFLAFNTSSGIDSVCTYTNLDKTYVSVEDTVNAFGNGSWNKNNTVKKHRLPALCDQFGFRLNKPFIMLDDFKKIELKKFGDKDHGFALLYDVAINTPNGTNSANLCFLKVFDDKSFDVGKELRNSMLWDGFNNVEVKCALIPFPTRLMLILERRGVKPVIGNWYNTFPLMNAIEAHCENYNCDFNNSVTHLVVKADVKHC